MNRPAAPLAGAAVVILLLACGDDDGTTTTTTTSTTETTTTTTTRPADDPVDTEEVAVAAVDVERLEVEVGRPEEDRTVFLALDPAAEVTVQGAGGPTPLPLDELPGFVDQRLAELGGLQAGVPFTIEVTGRGTDRRVTALREIPPG